MANELETCAAAFVRIKGKEVFTENEFKMEVTLNLKWVSSKEAEQLIKVLLSNGIFTKSNGYLKVSKDLSSVQVPIAYHPSPEIKKLLPGTVKNENQKDTSEKPKDLFRELMDIAVENGIAKGKFVSESNNLMKKLGVDVCVAAILFLRDNGVNVEKLTDRAYAQVLGK